MREPVWNPNTRPTLWILPPPQQYFSIEFVNSISQQNSSTEFVNSISQKSLSTVFLNRICLQYLSTEFVNSISQQYLSTEFVSCFTKSRPGLISLWILPTPHQCNCISELRFSNVFTNTPYTIHIQMPNTVSTTRNTWYVLLCINCSHFVFWLSWEESLTTSCTNNKKLIYTEDNARCGEYKYKNINSMKYSQYCGASS